MSFVQSIQELSQSSQATLQTVVNIFLQSTVLLAVALLALLTLRRQRPTLLALICRAALVGVIALVAVPLLIRGQIKPIWSLAIPQQNNVTVLDSPAIVETNRAFAALAAPAQMAEPAPPVTEIGHSEYSDIEEAVPAKPISVYDVLGIIWLSGTVGMVAWLTLCHAHVLRIRKGSTALQEGETLQLLQELAASLRVQSPLLLVSEKVSSPYLTGFWRAAILLPATYHAEFDRDAMRAVLIHELAHLQRHDCRWNFLARVSCALLWPQPLLWMLWRRMEHISEDICDQIVVQDGCSPQQYASCLLNLAERLALRPTERVAGAGVLPVRSALGRRVQQILDSSRRGTIRLSPRLRALVSVATFCAVAAITMLVTVRVAPGKDEATNHQTGDLSSPKAAIETYYAALNEGNAQKVHFCLFDRPIGGIDLSAVNLAIKSLKRSNLSLTVSGLHIVEVMPGYATAVLRVSVRGQSKQPKLSRITTGKVRIYLRRQKDKWQIIEEPFPVLGNPATISGRLVDKDGRPAAGIALLAEIRSGKEREQVTRQASPKTPEKNRALYRMCSTQDMTQPDGTFAFTGLTTARYQIRLSQRQPWKTAPLGTVSVEEGKRIVVAIRLDSTVPSRVDSAINTAPHLDSPGNTIRSFAEAVNRGDFKLAALCVSGAKPNALTALQEWNLKQSGWNFSITSSRINNQTNKATASLKMNVKGHLGNKQLAPVEFQGLAETLPLSREGSNWRILPESPPEPSKVAKFGLGLFATALAFPASRFDTKHLIINAERTVTGLPHPVSMPRGTAAITGRVIYEDGSPAKGFTVLTEPRNNENLPGGHRSREFMRSLFVGGTTVADGTYDLKGLAAGVFDLRLDDGLRTKSYAGGPSYGWGLIMSNQGVKTQAGKTCHARDIILLKRSAMISGKVVDTTTGKPLPGVVIIERGPLAPGSPVWVDQAGTTTDKQGRYTLRVAPGTNYIGTGFHTLPDQTREQAANQQKIDVTTVGGATYARNDGVEVNIDGGQPQTASSGAVYIQTRKGQTRDVTFRLRRLS